MERSRQATLLDAKKIIDVFRSGGQLSRFLRGFEIREQQEKMLSDVVEAYNGSSIGLIEAGTGTGKSLAYLVPAIVWALQNRQCTVVSTNTINLQEQLLYKDIPLIRRVLNADFKAALVKGMGNYLCLRKLNDILGDIELFEEDEQKQIEKIDSWSRHTRDGSRSSLPIVPLSSVWDKVYAEGEACNGNKCLCYDSCFFFKARKLAAHAQILLVNHHLLFSDIASRVEEDDYSKTAILPPYDHLILDEAHNIEDVATRHLAFRVSRFDLIHLLEKLSSEKQGYVVGKLFTLKDKIYKVYPGGFDEKIHALLNYIDIELAGERRQLHRAIHIAFQRFISFIKGRFHSNSFSEDFSSKGYKLRFREKHFSDASWKDEASPSARELISSLKRYICSLLAIEDRIKLLGDEKLYERTKDVLMDLNGAVQRLDRLSGALEEFAFGEDHVQIVRWVEFEERDGIEHLSLIGARLDVSELLSRYLFSKFSTVILCSATLATDRHFHFIRQRLGINDRLLERRDILESIYDSPFDYSKQAIIAVPTDMPNPLDENFSREAAEKIWSCIHASKGNTFLLFTSFSMLQKCYGLLSERLKRARYVVFKQGEEQRQALLERFKKTDYSVLFGTDSFWEGVDVVGEALRCVVMVKLPFQVPSDPIVQARMEAIRANGGNAFMDYSIPNAIVKFKQGFGRLIRNKRDRGCIVCLDPRLTTKSYGRFFFSSLPESKKIFDSVESIQKKMQDFYRKTHYLTKKEVNENGA